MKTIGFTFYEKYRAYFQWQQLSVYFLWTNDRVCFLWKWLALLSRRKKKHDLVGVRSRKQCWVCCLREMIGFAFYEEWLGLPSMKKWLGLPSTKKNGLRSKKMIRAYFRGNMIAFRIYEKTSSVCWVSFLGKTRGFTFHAKWLGLLSMKNDLFGLLSRNKYWVYLLWKMVGFTSYKTGFSLAAKMSGFTIDVSWFGFTFYEKVLGLRYRKKRMGLLAEKKKH